MDKLIAYVPSRGRTLCAALLAIALAPICAAAEPAKRPQIETVQYTIVKGDTCAGIARRFYGDGTRWDVIHEFNPRLGPQLPHRLVPGETLTLPPTLPPDAWVTEVVRRVDHRSGRRTDWAPARRGTPLEVGYRVSTHARSAAELTFRDESQVELHQNTLLVIYGRVASETRVRPNRVRLARGTLASRLAALRGEPADRLQVDSDAAVATLGSGEAILAVAGDGASAISNHEGGSVRVASTGAAGEVEVGAGMGTRVEKGKAPEPPRPLPASPVWTDGPATAWGATAEAAVIELEWKPDPVARGWRLILERDGQPFAAARLPLDPPRQRLSGLPAGTYSARLTVTDAAGLVSRPSAPRAFTIGAVADGSRIVRGAEVTGCAATGSRRAAWVATEAGSAQLVCGGLPVTVEVVEP